MSRSPDQSPVLTVCIPAYNRPEFLRETLTSLCDQGLSRDQYAVVVSDDASPAPLSGVVDAFRDRLQIIYDRSATNIGHIANFERAFQLASSPYVSFLSHDDAVSPGHLARALAAAEQHQAVLVASLTLCQRHPGALHPYLHGLFPRGAKASFVEPYLFDRTEWMALALTGTPLSIVGAVFHAETFRRCRHWRQFPLWHDRLMLAEMGLHGAVISLPWVAGYYRVGEFQLSAKLSAEDGGEFRAVSDLLVTIADEHQIPALDFWVDQLCAASDDERMTYLEMLFRALREPQYEMIKTRAEQRLQRRLHMGGRLDRLGVPRSLINVLRVVDRTLVRRKG